MAQRHGALGRLTISRYQHIGDLLQLSLANLISDLFLPVVHFDAEPGRSELLPHLARVPGVTIRDRKDGHLHGRQPQRERPGEVFDQDRDEALERAADRAVDDDGAVFGVVLSDVIQIEALGRGVVELDRASCQARPSESVTSKSIFGP